MNEQTVIQHLIAHTNHTILDFLRVHQAEEFNNDEEIWIAFVRFQQAELEKRRNVSH